MDQDRLIEDVKRTAEYFRAEAAELRRRVAALEGALKGVCKLRKKTEATHQAAYEAMFKLPGRKVFEDAADALAATPAGGEAGKDSARLDHLIDRKLLSCDVFEDAAEMCIKAGCEDPDNDRRWVRAAIDRSEEEGRC